MLINLISSQEFHVPPRTAPAIRILALAKGLREIGVGVQIITKRLAGQQTKSIVNGIALYRPWVNFVDPRAYVKALLHYGRKADVHHLRGIPLLPGIWTANRFLNHRPIVIDGTGLFIHSQASPTFHLGYRPEAQVLRPFENKWAFEKAILDHVECILCTTHAVREWYRKSGIPAQKLKVIPLGVDTITFNPKTVSPVTLPDINPKHPVITYIGGVQAYQGLDNLLNAIPLVINSNPNALFLLVLKATPNQIKSIKQEITKLNVKENVILHSNIPHHMIPQYLKRSTIVTIPMRSTIQTEMFSAMKLMEAIAMGVPLVATNLQATQEIVTDQESALLVTTPQPENLAKKITRLLDEPNLRTQLGQNALEVAQKYSWKEIAAAHQDVYQSLI